MITLSFDNDIISDTHGCEYTLAFLAESDLAAMVALENKASDFPWSSQNFRDSLLSSHICVGVKSDGALVAQAVFSLVADEAELLILAVSPEKKGRKIATALLDVMENVLSKKANSLFLEVRASNARAIGLYESLGYNQVGERPNYYPAKSGREDALIFAKHINF
ncbi:MAG: ribosomal protein S18-alanine N-acetyltransferase [Agarilytica sp.]